MYIKHGFTLIELLIVIAVIGLLSSIILASLNDTRKKGRDARRIADLAQIRNALELYYDDHGYYPQSSCGYDCNGYFYSYNSSWNTLASELAPYIGSLPKDPINSSCPPWNASCYSYAYGNIGRYTYKSQYDLTTQLEDPNHPQRCSVRNFKFFFNATEPWCGPYSGQIYEASII